MGHCRRRGRGEATRASAAHCSGDREDLFYGGEQSGRRKEGELPPLHRRAEPRRPTNKQTAASARRGTTTQSTASPADEGVRKEVRSGEKEGRKEAGGELQLARQRRRRRRARPRVALRPLRLFSVVATTLVVVASSSFDVLRLARVVPPFLCRASQRTQRTRSRAPAEAHTPALRVAPFDSGVVVVAVEKERRKAESRFNVSLDGALLLVIRRNVIFDLCSSSNHPRARV